MGEGHREVLSSKDSVSKMVRQCSMRRDTARHLCEAAHAGSTKSDDRRIGMLTAIFPPRYREHDGMGTPASHAGLEPRFSCVARVPSAGYADAWRLESHLKGSSGVERGSAGALPLGCSMAPHLVDTTAAGRRGYSSNEKSTSGYGSTPYGDRQDYATQ